jgi:hypothetical protein
VPRTPVPVLSSARPSTPTVVPVAEAGGAAGKGQPGAGAGPGCPPVVVVAARDLGRAACAAPVGAELGARLGDACPGRVGGVVVHAIGEGAGHSGQPAPGGGARALSIDGIGNGGQRLARSERGIVSAARRTPHRDLQPALVTSKGVGPELAPGIDRHRKVAVDHGDAGGHAVAAHHTPGGFGSPETKVKVAGAIDRRPAIVAELSLVGKAGPQCGLEVGWPLLA